MDDFLRATHNTVKDNDAKVLAAKMGLPHVSLLQRSNPDDDAHRLTVEHLYGILLHSGDMRPLEALADEFGFDLVAREKPAAQELTSAALHMNAEVADVMRLVTNIIDRGFATQSDRADAAREISEAVESLVVVKVSLGAA
ncbi:Rha family transcriptional regulator [Halopseudomonas aestusnigri]|uniref:phage regulatory CII family protein n=1 Tax=Halopseudomonas aestusnigri TaxID=857252 RepID=UPI000C50DE38|nr:phage regulatory CII family protein [Halopseudomonas aestusnigri]MAD27127.1 Rha family transcriptional regulator [Pseudomonadales bacterium]MDL2200846.1 Rha family transcriptional regulator [Halopseudomonas aestusnigri]|tara:strand:- start:310 stop:732 length:423 start_codon:yes stop_codon:yes gene_type:complete